eukprot:INCI2369.1.p1 GENE.INCI2369.1~~INCI2369.1.p1  ORF type:complete len:752 (+),score=136.84 INCI2369.1:60-2315(+)
MVRSAIFAATVAAALAVLLSCVFAEALVGNSSALSHSSVDSGGVVGSPPASISRAAGDATMLQQRLHNCEGSEIFLLQQLREARDAAAAVESTLRGVINEQQRVLALQNASLATLRRALYRRIEAAVPAVASASAGPVVRDVEMNPQCEAAAPVNGLGGLRDSQADCPLEVEISLKPGKPLPLRLVRCSALPDDGQTEQAMRQHLRDAARRRSTRPHLESPDAWGDPVCLSGDLVQPQSSHAAVKLSPEGALRRASLRISPADVSIHCLQTLALRELLVMTSAANRLAANITLDARSATLGAVQQRLLKNTRKIRVMRFASPAFDTRSHAGGRIRRLNEARQEHSASQDPRLHAQHVRENITTTVSAHTAVNVGDTTNQPADARAPIVHVSDVTERSTASAPQTVTLPNDAGVVDGSWDAVLNNTARQQAVVKAFEWAWVGYRLHAWGRDELKPLSRKGHDWFGLGLTLIDALDTMYIMGLRTEFDEAVSWVASSLDFQSVTKDVNVFETTIRVLGGLLSAHMFSGEHVLREKAIELADRLLPAFETPSGIPFSDVNLKTGKAHGPTIGGSSSSTAEATSVQLEFKYLSYLTGDPKYANAANKVMDVVAAATSKENGLVPIFIDPSSGKFQTSSRITLGARGDSYYEYLLKQWLITSKTEERFKQAYLESVDGMIEKLVKQSKPSNFTYIAELTRAGRSGTVIQKMDHLVCFLPGTLALGVLHGVTGPISSSLSSQHMDLAIGLLDTCLEM